MSKVSPLEVAVDAARRAGAVLLAGLSNEKRISKKTHRHDIVTTHDCLAEEAIVERILAAFPEDGILSEEGTRRQGRSSKLWVIDPLDGTSNFARGIPVFSTSIARLRDGQPEVACIYDPVREEAFTAICGEIPELNGRRISVSDQPTLDGALVAVGFSVHADRRARTLTGLRELIGPVQAIRTSGSAALDLAYLAAGRIDAVWYVALHEWDVAAGRLLIASAGGAMTSLSGGVIEDPSRGVLATNSRIHRELLAALSGPRAL